VAKVAEHNAARLLRLLRQVFLVNTEGERDGGGLVEQAQAVEAADTRGGEHCMALLIVERHGHTQDAVGHLAKRGWSGVGA
jgi:hypothetical protein